jgi:hypothetical protein
MEFALHYREYYIDPVHIRAKLKPLYSLASSTENGLWGFIVAIPFWEEMYDDL